jgi:hypothetical protein
MAVINPKTEVELRKDVLHFLKRKDVVIQEYAIHPIMDGKNKYTGKVVVEIVVLQQYFDVI